MGRVVPSQVVAVIEKIFPQVHQEVEGKPFGLTQSMSAECTALLDLLEQIPSQLLVMDNDHYVEYISSISAIRDTIEFWRRGGYGGNAGWFIDRVRGLRAFNPVSLIRFALAVCPDEVPSPTTTELPFITDAKLRVSLRLDISTANGALVNGEWKAATVLAGSVVETLLLWALERKTPQEIPAAIAQLNRKPNSNIQKWDLADYIDVAEVLKIIKPETVSQCRLAKNFRNLIHPGRAQRLGQPCNRGTALSAVAAIEHVVNDLTP